jgi:hypothetical protein
LVDVFGLAIVEGAVDEAVTRKLLSSLDIEVPTISDKRGGGNFWKDAARIARHRGSVRVFGLVDLESSPCAPGLLERELGKVRHERLIIRIAVRMVESWLLADREGIASALRIPAARIDRRPDTLKNPKQRIANLARESRSRTVREDLTPVAGSGALVGPGYVAWVSQFTRSAWNPINAAANSDSLDRAVRRLTALREMR